MGGTQNSHLDLRLRLARRSIGVEILARTLAERRVLLRKQVGGQPAAPLRGRLARAEQTKADAAV